MPTLGLLIGGVDFKDLKLVLKAPEGKATAITLNYGMFLQNVFDFLIIAFVIFLAITVMNKLKKKQEAAPAAPPAPSAEEKLLTEIRDLLKK
jgi:large conductance mechanosensitive channel